MIAPSDLDAVFGPDSNGLTEIERARSSTREFVRSQDHLALAKENSEGRRFTAVEALSNFHINKLVEAADRGVAIIAASRDEPARTLRGRREALGLSLEAIAKASNVPIEIVKAAEDTNTRTPIRSLERIAMALGLDERYIAITEGAGGNRDLAVRLRTLGQAKNWFSDVFVASLAEAAWVIATQLRLQKLVRRACEIPNTFAPDANYGHRSYPAWRHGYYLAQKARSALNLGEEPIPSMRTLCWRLGIPLVHARLPEHFAGATLTSAEGRGIVVNTVGRNANVWIRRSTIAHELGHFFWDPEDRLQNVTVDNFEDMESSRAWGTDLVEARTNAFAVELLAPLKAVEAVFHRARSLVEAPREVMEHFGISFTAARHHISNGLNHDVPGTEHVPTEPSDEWVWREGLTETYFPIPTTSQMRRGEFAGLVVAAQRQRLISDDTASMYLETDVPTYTENASAIAGIFPPDQI